MTDFIGRKWGIVKKKIDTSFIVGDAETFLRHVPNESIWIPEYESMTQRAAAREFQGPNADTIMTLDPPTIAYRVDLALAKSLVAVGGAQPSFTISSSPSAYIAAVTLQGAMRPLNAGTRTFLSYADADNICTVCGALYTILGLSVPPGIADTQAYVKNMAYTFTSLAGTEIVAPEAQFFENLFTWVGAVKSRIVAGYTSVLLSSTAGHILLL